MLHCREDIKLNQDFYDKLQDVFEIEEVTACRVMSSKPALDDTTITDFFAICRSVYQTRSEMNPWDAEMIYVKMSPQDYAS